MSTWTGPERGLWEAALAEQQQVGAVAGFVGRVRERVPARGVAAGLVAAAGLALVLVGAFGLDRDRPLDSTHVGDSLATLVEQDIERVDQRFRGRRGVSSLGLDVLGKDQFGVLPADSLGRSYFAGSEIMLGQAFMSGADEDDDGGRQISFSAAVSVESDDVRGLVDRVRGLIDAEAGEFVQGVSISGEGGNASGRLTLRVRGERLESVLASIRGFGGVLAEEVAARDMTDQLVDTEARLRNERRVEAELLELMETQSELELEGLIRLRRELGEVRGRIEQMQAGLVQMERMVALASVRVEVRGRDVQPEMQIESGWERFWGGVGAYWGDGVGTLGRTLGGLLSFAVGRVLWWLPGVILVGVAWRLWRRGRSAG